MTTLLLAEHDNSHLNPLTARALTAALALGAPVHVVVAGENCRPVAEAAATLEGVDKVILAEGPHLSAHLAEPLGALLLALAPDHDAVVAPATTTGKNVLPRLAALLDVMQLSEVIAIEAPDTFIRPVYAGNALEKVQTRDAKKIVTVRTSAFAPAANAGTAPIETVAPPPDPNLSAFEERTASVSDRPDLASARIVVSGGRAFGSRENFDKHIGSLAEKLGAAIGASRAAVDAGYAPNELQVGQTGRIVAPDLYIACGISGAIQHLAGMKDSGTIVAINKDPDAPIFQIADYGLVGDLFELMPELIEKL